MRTDPAFLFLHRRLARRALVLSTLFVATLVHPLPARADATLPAPIELTSGWQLQDAAKVTAPGAEIASPAFGPSGWYAAVVPGTVLTSLVKNGVYPDPLYGENGRPATIPDTLSRTSWWYRATVTIPRAYTGHHIWLNFDGINFAAQLWVNGHQAGTLRGAFLRGAFDISTLVQPGQPATLAVLVSPQPHPGEPHAHTLANGLGLNGGITAIDGPTFLSTIGWDWLASVADRDTGIWQRVFLSAAGPVLIQAPLVTTALPLPRTDSSDIAVKTTLRNITAEPQRGTLRGTFGTGPGKVTFERQITLEPNSSQLIAFDPTTTPALHVAHPRLWWPNGYGPQNLYTLHLTFQLDAQPKAQPSSPSDTHDTTFGVRKITYTVPGTDNLTVSVNGIPIFLRGGDWGLDEALKRNPRQRLEAQIRLHQLANLNLIRNWVGQSTSEDFYALCDKYGILLWDEFFQPNPSDGPNPDDLPTYLANVRDKILRFRNHPSIAIWCARNEGYPPKEIDDALRTLLSELEPTRLYQPSSTAGHGVHSGGPYHWRTPREFYEVDAPFKTEIGSLSVPTLESIHGMMPQRDWEVIDDDWAQHDFAKGAQSGGEAYRTLITNRYGPLANLADFVRKSQLANYEAFRAMYEGRQAQMFHPATAIITWMSNPAQASFVWQLYHHDLEPNSALFAVKKAGELVHIQLDESDGPSSNQIEVINNLPVALDGATALVTLYNLDGHIALQRQYDVAAPPSLVTSLGQLAGPGQVAPPTPVSPIHFTRLELRDSTGKLLSSNFYWQADPEHPDDLTALDKLAPITLEAKATRTTAAGNCLLTVTLHNPGTQVALMAHLQLHRNITPGQNARTTEPDTQTNPTNPTATTGTTGATTQTGQSTTTDTRVLPVYYSDNYVSLVPGETRTITLEAAEADLHGDTPLILIDGYNITGATFTSPTVSIAPNLDAQPTHWPTTGLPMMTTTTPPPATTPSAPASPN